jgi:thiosulfate/3-mercaptopyruvate sulfurtransferase
MRRLFPACALALVIAAPAGAQVANGGSRATLVVDATWLAQHLHEPGLVLLQVGTKDTYDKGHIPGARFADWMQLRDMDQKGNQLTLEMPAPERLHDVLESFGISDSSHVVVYASDEYWSPSTRVVLTLDYAGIKNVSYLDGGLKGWTSNGQATSKDASPASNGKLAPLTLRPLIVDAAFVQAHERSPGFTIVDARITGLYDGSMGGGQRGQEKKFGHIPGAVSAPYDGFASGDGQLKPDAEIAAIFEKAGVRKGDTVIGYCHVGQQATAMLFAARIQGHNVVLYDGSFEDWNARNLPIRKED